ncbi:MAG TPA: lysophospholipid acyltransferase family protein, partial [Pyrinomonadaceae bacterium]
MGWFSFWLGKLWLGAFGWKIQGDDQDCRKFVVIAAPHTSNWDLPFMLATAYAMRVHASWFGKHTAFKPPWGWLLRKLGGIPVDRRSPHSLVTQMAEEFRTRDHLVLAVSPEGTRSKVDFWKSGFYQIAVQSGVPIGLGYLDYKTKRSGIGMLLLPTGNIKADMDQI